MMGGPRGGYFGPGPGRCGTLMDTMRSGGGYGGGKQSVVFLHTGIFGGCKRVIGQCQRQQNKSMIILQKLMTTFWLYSTLSGKKILTSAVKGADKLKYISSVGHKITPN